MQATARIILGKHYAISRAQANAVEKEFNVRAFTRGVRNSEVKKGADPDNKALTMHGPAQNISAACKRLEQIMEENGDSGVAKDWHEQEALRRKMRQDAKEKKKKKVAEHERGKKHLQAKLAARSIGATPKCGPKPQQRLQPQQPKCPPPKHLLEKCSRQQQSGSSDDKPTGNEKLNHFQAECLEILQRLQDEMSELFSDTAESGDTDYSDMD